MFRIRDLILLNWYLQEQLPIPTISLFIAGKKLKLLKIFSLSQWMEKLQGLIRKTLQNG